MKEKMFYVLLNNEGKNVVCAIE